jgi:hypothetical protein
MTPELAKTRVTERRFRIAIVIFMVGLVLSGLTAFPLLSELNFIAKLLGVPPSTTPIGQKGIEHWISTVRSGLDETYVRYPWIAYGTDWLAFGHLAIALFFVGPLIRPRDSKGVILSGVAACILVVPIALICGEIREVPLYWRLIDCSFGLFGLLPLLYCLRQLEYIRKKPD